MESKLKCELLPTEVKAVTEDADDGLLEALGIAVNESIAMDALPNMLTTPNAGTPVQFLQFWDPEIVRMVTAPRKADEVMGRRIAGDWEDEEVVVKVLERVGQAKPYGDTSNVPFTNTNTEFKKATIVRFESGMEVSHLEQKRAAKMQVSVDAEKREGCSEALAIALNDVAFNGFSDGAGRTYGYLNEPDLPNYTAAARTIENSSFIQIVGLFQAGIAKLIKNTKGLFDPQKDSFEIVLPPSKQAYLTLPTEQYGGISVENWLNKNYPKARLVYAPQLDAANGGADVMYIHADRLNGMPVLAQNVQSVLYFLGFERKPKGQVEDYSAATAGFMLKVPVGLVRYTGV